MDCKYSNGALPATSIALSLLLAACGGGGGGGGGGDTTADTSDPAGDTNEPATRLKAGSYQTTVSRDQSGTQDNGITFLSPTGKFMTALPGSISFGNLTFDDGIIDGQATDFLQRQDGWAQVEGEVSGEVAAQGQATLDGTAPGFTSTIELERQQAFSNQGVTLADMNSTYSMVNSEGETEATVTVNASGELTGMDTADCQLNGVVTIPDNTVNVLELEYTASNCSAGDLANAEERGGDFSGLGTYDPEEGKLEFAANNGTVALLFIGTR